MPNTNIHRKRFNGGNRTPQEYHAQFAFPPNAKCSACSAKPQLRAIVMIPLDEAEKRGMVPPGAAQAPLMFPDIAPVLVPIRESGSAPSFYVRTSIAYSCKSCRKNFERALASAPSWAIVEINRGPDPTNRVSLGAS